MFVQNIREKKKLSIFKLERSGEIDYVLLSIVIIFYGIGIVMVFSASINEGMKLNNYTYFLQRQIMWVLMSVISCIIFIFIDHTALARYKKPLVWGIIILLLMLLLPPLIKAGIVHPSKRWFRFGGMGFQPSEFAKIVLIVYLASILSKKGGKINDFYRGFLPPFLVVSVISFLVFLEPDFSTAFILFFMSILMFFIVGIRSLSIISLILISIPAVYLMVSGKGYRKERIMGFLNPWSDPTDKGYQIIQSFKAFAYGGFFGAGLGKSIQKMKYLPIPHTDFIFAIIAEEMGFFGVILIIILYMLFAYRGFTIAYAQKGSFEFLLAFGITSLIVWEAIFNIAVVTGMLPSTGISLPFLSYGGSNLLANSILAGILLNLSKGETNQYEMINND
jgi:cell division protein FtsW